MATKRFAVLLEDAEIERLERLVPRGFRGQLIRSLLGKALDSIEASGSGAAFGSFIIGDVQVSPRSSKTSPERTN